MCLWYWVFIDFFEFCVLGKVGDVEEKKVLVLLVGEDKVVIVFIVGFGDDVVGVNLFDFLVMLGFLNVCYFYCIWIFIYFIFRSIIGLVFWGIYFILFFCLRIVF